MNLNQKAKGSYDGSRAETQAAAGPVLEALSAGFQITWFREVESKIWVAALKPMREVSDQFGLLQEYFIIGNGHRSDFHQRTLNISIPIEIKDRIDENLRFVASDAPVAPAFSAAWAKKNKANVVVISSDAMGSPQYPDLFALLSKTLWRHDYFSESEPVKTPSEFFGRQPLVSELMTRVILGTPIAVFGLRKIGKSSLLGRVENLVNEDSSSVTATAFLYGNATRIKSGRWWNLAQDAVNAWVDSLQKNATSTESKIRPKAERLNDLISKQKLDPVQLSRAFESDVSALLKSAAALATERGCDSSRLVLFLDECDHIYPLAEGAGYWKADFFPLWNTIQSIKRSLPDPSRLEYVLGGVNPSGVEQGALVGQPNPLFECERIYLPPMSADEVSSLLNGLGSRMGLQFESSAVHKLYELVGGHPLLVRRLASAVHDENINRTSRMTVDSSSVSRAFSKKKRELFNQVAWILEHLALVAPDEERLLRDIAVGGSDAYADIWGDSEFRETFAFHLERYGLLRFENDLPVMALGIVGEALKRPAASEFKEQKKNLKDLIDSLEDAIRTRIREDIERNRHPDDAVEIVANAIPSDAKNRALARDEMVELGKIAGLEAVLQSLNWGDYGIIFRKFYDEISWRGEVIDKDVRIRLIEGIFEKVHVLRHNNDHEAKKLIDSVGYNALYAKFSSLRESLAG